MITPPTGPAALSATEARDRIAAGTLTSATLMQACLDRIAAREGIVGAWESLDPPRALAAARASDAAPAGAPLRGLPVAVKDIIDTSDYPTGYGSPIYRGHRPAADAGVVRRLRAAGAVVLGKTVTTEFAYQQPGKTVNPHDPARTPGGSSSGSAAAVADYMAPLALGTQTGGSVIRPAAFCGIFGFKPSWGRTDLAGVHELAGSFDTVGWFARSAADLGLLAPVLLADFRAAPAPSRPRIALCRTPYDEVASPEAMTALRDAGRRLADSGAEIVEMALPPEFAGLNASHRVIGSVDAVRAFGRDYDEHRDLLSPVLRQLVETGRACKPETHEAAQRHAESCRAALAEFAPGIDAFLVPSAPGEAPATDTTGDAVFSLFWSLLRVPCVTLPVARGPNGLPLGVQLVGRMHGDEALLALAANFPPPLRERVGPVRSAGG